MNKLQVIDQITEYFSYGTAYSGYIWYPKNLSKITEYAGRKCYNSNDKIGEDTDISFNKRTMKSVHLSVLAHGFIGIKLMVHESVYGTFDDTVQFIKQEVFDHAKLMNVRADLEYHEIDIHFNIRSMIDLLNGVSKDLIENKVRMHDVYILTPLLLAIANSMEFLKPLYDLVSETILGDELIKGDFNNITWRNKKINSSYTDEGAFVATTAIGEIANGSYKLEPYSVETPINGIELNILNVSIEPQWLPKSKGYVIGHPYPAKQVSEEVLGSVTFHIRIPRIVSQQELRHWESVFTDELMFELSAVSQMSQRYVNEENMECYTRDTINRKKEYPVKIGNVEFMLTVDDLIEIDRQMYGNLLKDGFKKEEARDILPNGTWTEVIITKEFRALPHYFAERTAPGAQLEIRAYASPLMDFMKSLEVKEDAFKPSKYNANLAEIK